MGGLGCWGGGVGGFRYSEGEGKTFWRGERLWVLTKSFGLFVWMLVGGRD